MGKKTKDQEILNFRDLSRQYSEASIVMHDAIARKMGLSATDQRYLGILLDKGQMTAGELSKLTGLTTGAATGLADRLEKKKLAKRQFDKSDRRKVIIVPNEDITKKRLTPLLEGLNRKIIELLNGYSESEIKALQKYFISVTNLMKETAEELNSE